MPETDPRTEAIQSDPERIAMTIRVTETRMSWDEDPAIEVIVSERGRNDWHVSTFMGRGLPDGVRRPERHFPTIERAQAYGARLLAAIVASEKAYREAQARVNAAFMALEDD